MSLFNIIFPENASFFNSLLIQISSFDIIPSFILQWVKSKIFNFSKDQPEETFIKFGY